MRRALARARDGKALDVAEAAVLLHARGEDLDTLLGHASRVRDAGLEAAGRPGVITYSRKVFIPLTRLCRDRCGYCTFATVPGRLPTRRTSARTRCWRSPGRARRWAARRRCSPSATGPRTAGTQAREWLDAHGYDDTLSYVRAMAIRVLEETGLLPHLNPGVMTWQDLQRLKPVAPSMGMMLETTSRRLFEEKGRAALRLAGQGPGGTAARAGGRGPLERAVHHRHADRHRRDRARTAPSRSSRSGRVAREYGGIQEVIVQNFRAKPDTAMRGDARRRPAGAGRHDRGRPGSCSARRRASRRRRTWSTPSTR